MDVMELCAGDGWMGMEGGGGLLLVNQCLGRRVAKNDMCQRKRVSIYHIDHVRRTTGNEAVCAEFVDGISFQPILTHIEKLLQALKSTEVDLSRYYSV